MRYIPLPKRFYIRDTIQVSKELLGKILVRKIGNKTLAARIVETEAYIGEHDPAAHSYGRITERNKIMYGSGGFAYVYFIYGNYYCFNIVTGKEGEGNAVLIRAAEPVEGIDDMKKFRGNVKNVYELTNGPAKLCLSMRIDKKLNGIDITKMNVIFISSSRQVNSPAIQVSKRIGLRKGEDFMYRFFMKDNLFVTKHRHNNESGELRVIRNQTFK